MVDWIQRKSERSHECTVWETGSWAELRRGRLRQSANLIPPKAEGEGRGCPLLGALESTCLLGKGWEPRRQTLREVAAGSGSVVKMGMLETLACPSFGEVTCPLGSFVWGPLAFWFLNLFIREV